MDELKRIIEKLHMDKDDVICEVELVEECGEYQHMPLIGYSADELRAVAEQI